MKRRMIVLAALLTGVPHTRLLLGLALFIPLFIWDKRRDGHVHPATWIGFSLSAIAVLVPLFVFWTGVNWAGVAAKLPGVGT